MFKHIKPVYINWKRFYESGYQRACRMYRLQVKRKQSSASGVTLGEDVLSLEVEALPHVNHLLIMALVIVYGLIEDKL